MSAEASIGMEHTIAFEEEAPVYYSNDPEGKKRKRQEDARLIGSATSSLTPLKHGNQAVLRESVKQRSVLKGVLGFTGCLLMLAVPGIPTEVKANLIGGYGMSVGASCIANALAKPGDKNRGAKFFQGFANKCMWLGAINAFSEYGKESFQQMSPGMNEELADGLGKISGRIMADSFMNSKAYGEYHFGSNLTAGKGMGVIVVNGAFKGLFSPFVLGMIVPGGQFGVASFLVFVIGRSIVDMVLNNKSKQGSFLSVATIKEAVYLMMFHSLSFASLGALDTLFMPSLTRFVPALSSSTLAQGVITAAYSVAAEQFIVEPVAKMVSGKHEAAPKPSEPAKPAKESPVPEVAIDVKPEKSPKSKALKPAPEKSKEPEKPKPGTAAHVAKEYFDHPPIEKPMKGQKKVSPSSPPLSS
jgi:hypothetical protein